MKVLHSNIIESIFPEKIFIMKFYFGLVRFGYITYQPLLAIYCKIHFYANKASYFKQFSLA